MKKIICGTEYDTAASTVVKKVVNVFYTRHLNARNTF